MKRIDLTSMDDSESDPLLKDSLFWFSTEEEYASFKHEKKGSFFIQKVTAVRFFADFTIYIELVLHIKQTLAFTQVFSML